MKTPTKMKIIEITTTLWSPANTNDKSSCKKAIAYFNKIINKFESQNTVVQRLFQLKLKKKINYYVFFQRHIQYRCSNSKIDTDELKRMPRFTLSG